MELRRINRIAKTPRAHRGAPLVRGQGGIEDVEAEWCKLRIDRVSTRPPLCRIDWMENLAVGTAPFVDAHCSWAQAKLYLSKIPMSAVDLLHDRVLPIYEAAGVALDRILTDNGREFCGRPLVHPYELYLAVQQIQHRNTKGHHPQTNGFCERFHRTLKDEFFIVALRKKLYGTLQELQEDLDTWLRFYNEEGVTKATVRRDGRRGRLPGWRGGDDSAAGGVTRR